MKTGELSRVITELLHARLASKINEDEMTIIINDINHICGSYEMTISQHELIDKTDRIKNSLDYIEHKCGEIERTIRITGNRHRSRNRERVFRDRTPLGLAFGACPLTHTQNMTAEFNQL
jgi:hypothetical protein